VRALEAVGRAATLALLISGSDDLAEEFVQAGDLYFQFI